MTIMPKSHTPLINQLMRNIQVTGWSFVRTYFTVSIFQRKDGSTLTVDIAENDIADRLEDFNRRHPQ